MTDELLGRIAKECTAARERKAVLATQLSKKGETLRGLGEYLRQLYYDPFTDNAIHAIATFEWQSLKTDIEEYKSLSRDIAGFVKTLGEAGVDMKQTAY